MDNKRAVTYDFDCGCKIPILGPVKPIDGLPSMEIDYENINLDCMKTYELLGTGRTKGVFQLESYLGRKWSKALKPNNIEEISALISLIRPSCLNCVSGDSKVSIRYYVRKNTSHAAYHKISIKDLYYKFINKDEAKYSKYRWDILSLNEDTLELINNKVLYVHSNGIKKIYKPKFTWRKRAKTKDSFYGLKCTLEHKLFSHDRGWVELQNLEKDERVALISNGNLKRQRKNGTKYTRWKSAFRDIAFLTHKYKCLYCDWKEGTLDVNHIDGNRKTNNHYDNLTFLCPNHHRLYSEGKISRESLLEENRKNKLRISDDIIWAEYNGCEYISEEETYDLTVDGPYFNYIADNVIVHNSKINNKSLTEHYVERKHGREKIEVIHPSLETILESTYGINCYQEQSLFIATQIAGFNLIEADELRRAIGKKLPEVMAKVKVKFIEGCKRVGIVNEDIAQQIFSWIQESQRYSFNHSITGITQVETKTGYKNIFSLQIGEEVNGPDGFVKVLNKFNHGIENVFSVIINGNYLECTLGHKLLCENGQILPLYQIIIHDLPIVCKNGIGKIDKIEYLGKLKVYDIEVDSESHLYYQGNICGHNSHAISYGLTGYYCAYAKQHFPLHFYCAWMNFAKEKMFPYSEISELVEEAKYFGIDTLPPTIKQLLPEFYICNGSIVYGLNSVKNIGQKHIQNLADKVILIENQLGKNVADLTWSEFLTNIELNKTVMNSMISCGVMDCYGIDRQRMLLEYSVWHKLTEREQNLIKQRKVGVVDGLNLIREEVNKKRLQVIDSLSLTLASPPMSTQDTLEWTTQVETELFGLPISCTRLDNTKITAYNKCGETVDGPEGTTYSLLMELVECRHFKTKSGKNAGQMMCAVTGKDDTATLDNLKLFPQNYPKYKNLLYDGNIVLIKVKSWKDILCIDSVAQA